MLRILISVFFTIGSLGILSAQSFKQDQAGTANGVGSASSATFQNKVTVGQGVVGTASSAGFISSLGFEFLSASDKTFDLTLENLAVDPATLGPGNDISLSFDLRNLGDGILQGDSYSIGIYLSTDQTIDTGEDLTTIVILSDIGPDGTYSFPQAGDNDKITIPAGTSQGSYFIILRADNGTEIVETNESNNEATTALTITSDGTAPVLSNFVPTTYFNTGSTVSVTVTDNVGVGTVNFYHRGITAPDSQGWGTPEAVTATAGTYSVELQASWLDDQGVEYWFEAFDTSNNRGSTGIEYTYFQTVGGELLVPVFKKGRTVSAYEIFSIPFDLSTKDPTSIFAEAFGGTYDPKKWRMFQYTGGSIKEFRSGWNTIDIGHSYWIINDVDNSTRTSIGGGQVPQSNKDEPFTINLVQGWNQIGNPYRFDVQWADILTSSGTPAEIGRFITMTNGSYVEETILRAFRGGFVFTTAPAALSIPVSPPAGSSAHQDIIARKSELKNPIDNDNWEVDFVLSNEELEFRFGGFGMREDADESLDRYDMPALPRFLEFIDMTFSHPECFMPAFSKDVIPPAGNQIWTFEVEALSNDKQITLSWDNSYFGDNETQLVLLDVERQTYVNMRDFTNYQFTISEKHEFKILYGDSGFIEEELNPSMVLLGNNYPNPFAKSTIIPFTLPPSEEGYEVELKIYNQMGQVVEVLVKNRMGQGFHEIEWDGSDMSGSKVADGIYIYRLIVTDKKLKEIQTRKLAIN